MKLPKDNYTKIPHMLVDQLMRDLGECDLKALLFIFRHTFGWNRETVTCSLAFIAEQTGMDRGALCRSMHKLEAMGIVSMTKIMNSDGGCSGVTYDLVFDTPPVAGEHPPLLPAGNVIRSIEKEDIEKTPSTPTPSERLDRTSAKRIWEQHFPKLKQSEREKFGELAGDVDVSEATFEAAVRKFAPWAKSKGDIRCPFALFLVDVGKWADSVPASKSPDLPTPVRHQTPTVAPQPLATSAIVPDFEVWLERQYARHPKKKSKEPSKESARRHFRAGKFTMEQFEKHHVLWCLTEQWKGKQGNWAPTLADWIEDDGYMYPPPPDLAEGEELPGHMNPGLIDR